MISQAKLLRITRRLTVGAAFIGGVYLVMRFNVTTVPEGRCCPLVRFEPGAQIMVDGKPSKLNVGDAILVKDSNGNLQLTLVDKFGEDGRVWCDTDREGCPGFTSEVYGWVSRDDVAGRVLLSWGS